MGNSELGGAHVVAGPYTTGDALHVVGGALGSAGAHAGRRCDTLHSLLDGEGHFDPSLDLEGCLPLPTQSGDALFDGPCFPPQALQILFEPGDLFCVGPKAWPRTGMPPTTAGSAMMSHMLTAPARVAVMVTVMALMSTAHVLTSLLY